MATSFKLKEIFSVTPEVIYNAWLNSKQHSKMTGGEAICSDKVGGIFSTWDEYITGTNSTLVPNQKIEQTWRTNQFNEKDEDSILILEFKEIEEGCELTLLHKNIPEGQSNYEQGWIEHYFEPMKAYFNSH